MKVKLLKQLRNEAIYNLDFVGGWTGCWITEIKGIKYESDEVSSLNFVELKYFVQNAIAHRVNIMKYGEKKDERIYKKIRNKVYLSTKYKKREYKNRIIQDKISFL